MINVIQKQPIILRSVYSLNENYQIIHHVKRVSLCLGKRVKMSDGGKGPFPRNFHWCLSHLRFIGMFGSQTIRTLFVLRAARCASRKNTRKRNGKKR